MSNSSESDRKLGEEWGDWDGSTQAQDTRAPGWIFLMLAGLTDLVLVGTGLLTVWLMYPRFQSFGLGTLLFVAGVVWSGYLLLWYLIVVAAGLGGVFSIWARRLGGIDWIVTPAIALGQWMGFSKDKLVHSYLSNHNRLEHCPRIHDPKKLLVLAPRCLSREMMQALRQLQTQYQFSLVIAVGGTEARRAIGEVKPFGIIGIACERDLWSGVKDLHGRVPIWTLPNLRPEGPCKNTVISIPDLERILNCFLGNPVTPARA